VRVGPRGTNFRGAVVTDVRAWRGACPNYRADMWR
jgi:hypothetical protein